MVSGGEPDFFPNEAVLKDCVWSMVRAFGGTQ